MSDYEAAVLADRPVFFAPMDEVYRSYVQSIGSATTTSSVTQLQISVTKTITVGNKIVASVAMYADRDSTIAVTDNLGNTYTLTSSVAGTSPTRRVYMFVGAVTTGGTLTTITASWTTATSYNSIVADEFSGVGTATDGGESTGTGTTMTWHPSGTFDGDGMVVGASFSQDPRTHTAGAESGVMQAAHLQLLGEGQNGTAGQTSTVLSPVGRTVKFGNVIVVGWGCYSDITPSGVTDNLGNTYTRVERLRGTNATSDLWYAPVTKAGPITTITVAHASTQYVSIVAAELFGVATSPSVGGGTTGSSTTPQWATNKTIPAYGLIIGHTTVDGSETQTAGAASGSPSTSIRISNSSPKTTGIEHGLFYAFATSSQVTSFNGTATNSVSRTWAGAGAIFSPKTTSIAMGTNLGNGSVDPALSHAYALAGDMSDILTFVGTTGNGLSTNWIGTSVRFAPVATGGYSSLLTDIVGSKALIPNGVPVYGAAGPIAGHTAIRFNSSATSAHYLTVGDHADLDLDGSDATFEFWYARDTDSGKWQGIISKAGSYGVSVNTNDQIALVLPGTGTFFNVGVTVPADGSWHHYVLQRRDGATADRDHRLFIDGVEQKITYQTFGYDIDDNSNVLHIGADKADEPSGYFDAQGKIAYVAIYKHWLSAAQVAKHYEVAKGKFAPVSKYAEAVLKDRPLGYWRFGESSGTVANNSGLLGSAHNGTYQNSVVFGMPGPLVNDTNGALGFDSDSPVEWVSVEGATALDAALVTNFSIECWAYFHNAATYPSLMGKGAAAPEIYRLASASKIVLGKGSAGEDARTNSTIALDTWYHVVATYGSAAKSGKIYINGVADYTSDATGQTYTSGTTDIGWGAFPAGSYPMGTGSAIAEAAIYDYVLTPEQVAAHYAAAKAPDGAVTRYASVVRADSPVAYWRLGEKVGGRAYLIVADKASLTTTDSAVKSRLEGLGYVVTVQSDDDAEQSAVGYSLVVVAESVVGTTLSTKYKTIPIPVVLLDTGIPTNNLGLSAYAVPEDAGETQVSVAVATSQASAGLTGSQTVFTSSVSLRYLASTSVPASCVGVLTTVGSSTNYTCGTYEANALLWDSTRVPARRAWLTLFMEAYVGLQNATAWQFFDGLILWAVGAAPKDEIGTSHGIHINTPTLGVKGALTADPDTAVTFNGSSAYISVPDNAALDVGDVFSYEIWFKRARITSGVEVFLNKGSGTTSFGIDGQAGANQDKLFYSKSSSGLGAYSTIAITDTTTWHHAVLIKNGSSAYIYIDGIDRTGTVTAQTMVNSDTEFFIGRDVSGLNFGGSLDEIAIYNYALTAGQVASHYNVGKLARGLIDRYSDVVLGDGPVSYWRLGEGYEAEVLADSPVFLARMDESSGNITDIVGSKVGTASGTPSYGNTGPITGHTAIGGFASGTDFQFADHDDLDLDNGPLTIEVWHKEPAGGSGVRVWLNKGTNGPLIGLRDTHRFFFGKTGVESTQESTTLSTADQNWHHYAVTRKSGAAVVGDCILYIDGVAETLLRDTWTNLPVTTSSPLEIGNEGSSYSDTGYQSYLALYKTALPASRIAAHYAAGNPTKAFDSAGPHTGTYTGTVTLAVSGPLVGDPDKAASFGSGDYVSVPYASALAPLTNFSLEIWCKMTAGQSGLKTLMGRGSSQGLWVFLWDCSTNYVSLGNNLGTGSVRSGALSTDTWYHVVATYGSGAGTGKMYVNGVDVSVQDGNGTFSNPDNPTLQIGAEEGGSNWVGQLDEAAIYGYVLTPTQIAAHYAAGKGKFGPVSSYSDLIVGEGPRSYWRMDETSGTIAYDWVGANNLTYTNTPTLGQASPVSGTAIQFASTSSEYAAKTSPTGLPSGSAARSVEAWFRVTDTGVVRAIYSQGALATNQHLYINCTTTGQLQVSTYGTDGNFGSAGDCNDGDWHHVVVTVSGSGTTITVYFDGVLMTGATNPQTYPTMNTTLDAVRLGFSGGSQYMEGLIDEVAVYNYVLSPKQIADHYNAGKGKFGADVYVDTILSDSPSFVFPLDEASGSIKDLIGSLSGTASGSPTYGAGGPIVGHTAIDFATTSDYFTVADNDALDIDLSVHGFTLEVWHARDTDSGGWEVWGWKGTNGWEFGVSSDDKFFTGQGAVSMVAGSTEATVPADGSWHHYAASIKQNASSLSPADVDLYIDGQLVEKTFYSGIKPLPTALSAVIGTETTAGTKGKLAYMALYKKVLPAHRIAAHYETGRGSLKTKAF